MTYYIDVGGDIVYASEAKEEMWEMCDVLTTHYENKKCGGFNMRYVLDGKRFHIGHCWYRDIDQCMNSREYHPHHEIVEQTTNNNNVDSNE